MKILYLDLGMGAAGDMLSAALYDLLPDEDKKKAIRTLHDIGIPGIEISADEVSKNGIRGISVSVKIEGKEEHEHDEHDRHDHKHHRHHHGASMQDIYDTIDKAAVPEGIKGDAKAIYTLLADAESRVHGMPVAEIHLHEVGALDAIADIISVCYLMSLIAPDVVYASPVNTGSGHVHCAHGVLPVPAPATAELLKGIPMYGGDVEGELCTPTGAVLLRHFVDEFGDMPVFAPEAFGYGMGKKDFERVNCLRAATGSSENAERVTELRFSIDDMSGEDVGYAMEKLFEEGALEAYTSPINMKKSRPGVEFTVICAEKDKEKVIGSAFRNTTTIGMREISTKRYTMKREYHERTTDIGKIRYKVSRGYGVVREKPEYDDVAGAAERLGIPLLDARERIGGGCKGR